jgi:hypothetical protein
MNVKRCSLSLKKEHTWILFDKGALRRISGPKWDAVTEERKKLHTQELNCLYYSPNSLLLGWLTGYAERKEVIRHQWGEVTSRNTEDNIKMDLMETELKGVYWVPPPPSSFYGTQSPLPCSQKPGPAIGRSSRVTVSQHRNRRNIANICVASCKSYGNWIYVESQKKTRAIMWCFRILSTSSHLNVSYSWTTVFLKTRHRQRPHRGNAMVSSPRKALNSPCSFKVNTHCQHKRSPWRYASDDFSIRMNSCQIPPM